MDFNNNAVNSKTNGKDPLVWEPETPVWLQGQEGQTGSPLPEGTIEKPSWWKYDDRVYETMPWEPPLETGENDGPTPTTPTTPVVDDVVKPAPKPIIGEITDPTPTPTTPVGGTVEPTNPGIDTGDIAIPVPDGGETGEITPTTPVGGEAGEPVPTTPIGGETEGTTPSDSYQAGYDAFNREQEALDQYREGYEAAKQEYEKNHPTVPSTDTPTDQNPGTQTPSDGNLTGSVEIPSESNNGSNTGTSNDRIPGFNLSDKDYPSINDEPTNSGNNNMGSSSQNPGSSSNYGSNDQNGYNNQNDSGTHDKTITFNDDGTITVDDGKDRLTIDPSKQNASKNDENYIAGDDEASKTDDETKKGETEIPEVADTTAKADDTKTAETNTNDGANSSSDQGTGSTGGSGNNGTNGGNGGSGSNNTPSSSGSNGNNTGTGSGGGSTGGQEIPEMPSTSAPADDTPSTKTPTSSSGSAEPNLNTPDGIAKAMELEGMSREDILNGGLEGMSVDDFVKKYPETAEILLDKGIGFDQISSIKDMEPGDLEKFIKDHLAGGDYTLEELMELNPELKGLLEEKGIYDSVSDFAANLPDAPADPTNGGSTATPTTTPTSADAGGDNETFSLDVEKASQILASDINQDFTQIVRSLNDLVKNLGDLQSNFYSPAGKDSTIIYEECAKNIGVGGNQGLYPAIMGAHQWCSAVDQYVQDKVNKASSGNPYDD